MRNVITWFDRGRKEFIFIKETMLIFSVIFLVWDGQNYFQIEANIEIMVF